MKIIITGPNLLLNYKSVFKITKKLFLGVNLPGGINKTNDQDA
jgi:hypothetical protein